MPKKKTPTFVVKEMKKEDFLSTKILESSIQNRKKTVCGYGFSWLNIRWLRFERDSPLSFKFKESLNEDLAFYEVNLSKSSRGRPIQSLNIPQEPLYPQRRIVTDSKKQHMMDLLPYIPPIFHTFYKKLPIENKTRSGSKMNKPHEDLSDDEPSYE